MKETENQQFTVNRYDPDPLYGLNSVQVAERNAQGAVNTGIKGGTKTIPQIILGNLLTYYNLLFAVIALALIIEQSFNNLTFLVVVFANIVIGTVQEIKSKLTLDKLSLSSAPHSVVVRDGVIAEIVSEELVLDDIVVFSAGQQICADAILKTGELRVNESLVTGESDEVIKKPGDELISGSFIISGSGNARLDKVGKDSFVSKLTLDAKKIKKKQQPGMMRSLTTLIKVIGIIIIPFSIIMFVNQTRHLGHTTKEAVEATAAAMIGMIPEGLYLLTSIALAASVIRLAKKKTLVHDLTCIEALARVDVLCVDKTGTITDNKMTLNEIVPLCPEYCNLEFCESVLTDFTAAMQSENATMTALKEHFSGKTPAKTANAVLGFSSSTKFSSATFDDDIYVLGAPEYILKDKYDAWKERIEIYSSKGCRVLLLAAYETVPGYDIYAQQPLNPANAVPIALVILNNMIRPEAPKTFEYFAEQGVTVKVISGDNPLTVSHVAMEAGIRGADKYVDASTLDTDEKISKAILEYNVFGRVKPEQKRKFVRSLKASGHTVAMTGDGVNDVLALKDSDCSIAMASGSEAACSVSDLVLLNSDFSSMPSVVAEGRRVINNIERSASLFLVKNIFSFIMTLALIFIPFTYPFKPAQLSVVNLFMIGIPSFFLALAPNNSLVSGKFLSNVLYRALSPALTAVFSVAGVLLFSYAFKIPDIEMSTISVVLFGAVSWMMLYRCCKPFNWFRWTLWGTMGGLFLITVGLSIFVLPELFELYPLSLGSFLVLSVFLMLAYPAITSITIINDKIKNIALKIFRTFRKKIKEEDMI